MKTLLFIVLKMLFFTHLCVALSKKQCEQGKPMGWDRDKWKCDNLGKFINTLYEKVPYIFLLTNALVIS